VAEGADEGVVPVAGGQLPLSQQLHTRRGSWQRPERVLIENGVAAVPGTDGRENFECGRLRLTRWMR
jgi:hypothetical protein